MATKQTPNKDLMKSALKHYEEASSSIHHYDSSIPKAIKEYFKEPCDLSREDRQHILGGLETLLERGKIADRKIEYSSALERLQWKNKQLEERVERLENIIIKIRESI